MRKSDLPDYLPGIETIFANAPESLADGGSCIAGPNGEWIVEPLCNEEKLIVETIDHTRVREERQNFNAAGHYSRPDIFRLDVNRKRQTTAEFKDD